MKKKDFVSIVKEMVRSTIAEISNNIKIATMIKGKRKNKKNEEQK